VPELTVKRRYARGLRNFFDMYQPMAETWFVYDTSMVGPPRIVASGRRLETETVFR
jgi:predicted ABC-type ATPase